MHAIRRATLFTEERHPGIVYDDNHPLDRDPRHQPFLLLLDGAAVGVVRLDRREPGEIVVRLVAIVPERQGQGHGRALMRLVDDEAGKWGARRLMLNAHPSAVDFYRRLGWWEEVWDADELLGPMSSDSVQMTKPS